ncbi:sensor domain-containing diguanylate cyclase [Endothiovibrio diazotrophicus]
MLPIDLGELAALIDPDVADLPTIPAVALKLLQLTSNERTDAADLARVIEADAALAAKILRIVHSPLYRLRRRITSVTHAVSVLGFQRIREIALGVALFEQLSQTPRGPAFDPMGFWRHCLSVASLCKGLAEQTGYDDLDTAYVAGLLHDIGKIIIETRGAIAYGVLLDDAHRGSGPLMEEERKLFGIGHDDIGAWFCAQWGLPSPLVNAIQLHHRPLDHPEIGDRDAHLAALVSFADFIAWTQGIGSADLHLHPVMPPDVERLVDPRRIDLPALLHRMDEEVAGIGRYFNVAFPSADQLRANLLQASIELGRINASFHFALGGRPAVGRGGIPSSLTVPHHSLDPEEIIPRTLQAIHEDFACGRIMMYRIDLDSRSLVFEHLFPDSAERERYRDDPIPIIGQSGAFLECLRTRVPQRVGGATPVEQQALARLNARELAVLPIVGGNRVVGMLLIDDPLAHEPVSAGVLAAVATVANELGAALENARLYSDTRRDATHDGLTGLLNRRALAERLAAAIRRSRRSGSPMVVGMADIDHFKSFNDTFGHPVGDRVLKIVADILRASGRPRDVVGRYGGEEFIFIMEEANLDGGRVMAERFRRAVEARGRLMLERFPGHPLTVTVGLAEWPGAFDSAEALVAAADAALYRGKGAGRNRVEWSGR